VGGRGVEPRLAKASITRQGGRALTILALFLFLETFQILKPRFAYEILS
jgi:hypothetical protein